MQLPVLNPAVPVKGIIKTINQSKRFKLLRIVLLFIIVLGFAEQSLNLYSVSSTFDGMTHEVQNMTNLMLNYSSHGGLAIENFPLAGNIALYSNGLIENRIALAGFVWPFNDELLENQSVYYSIFPSLLNQSVFFANQTSPSAIPTYDGIFDGMVTNIGNFDLQVSYPLLDPLEGILPRNYVQFPGPSDLGGALIVSNNPLSREFYANYTVSVFEPCQGTVCINELNYGGCYNLFSFNNSNYAIPKVDGFFSPQILSQGGYPDVISANSTVQFDRALNSAVNSSISRIISDNNPSSFYTDQGIGHGNLSIPILTNDSSVVESGNNSLSVNISSNGTWGAVRVIKNYQTPQDWCTSNTLNFWLYGLDSGDKIVFNISDGVNNRSWIITDNYSGWQQIRLPLKDLAGCQGNNCDSIDLSHIVTFYWDFHTVGDHRIDSVALEP